MGDLPRQHNVFRLIVDDGGDLPRQKDIFRLIVEEGGALPRQQHIRLIVDEGRVLSTEQDYLDWLWRKQPSDNNRPRTES